MINMSLSEGYFPDKFKTAIVTPLLTKPWLEKSALKNYSPVSGLNLLSKLIERTVSKQLKDYLSLNNLCNIYQSAYEAGYSTETTLPKIKRDIYLNLAQGQPTALVLLDLSAAFDTIKHFKLFDCLSSWFGFSDTIFNWFKSYMSGQNQSVKINSSLSSPMPLLFGVP